MSSADTLVIERVAVGAATVTALVRVPPGVPSRTSAIPGLAESVIRLLPGISHHRCQCGSSHGVLSELADTQIVHLLEHLALELMSLSGSPRSLGGCTEWDFARDGGGIYRVSIEYDHDLVALAAVCEAASLLTTLCRDTGARIDLPDIVGRVSAARTA